MTLSKIVLSPLHLCETRAGNLAHIVGRIMFSPGRPMLVEHICGRYLEHSLGGKVLTAGYGDDFDIVHLIEDKQTTHDQDHA